MVRHQFSKRTRISYTCQKTLFQRVDSLAFAFTIFVKSQKPESALRRNWVILDFNGAKRLVLQIIFFTLCCSISNQLEKSCG
jgi:hypothetical protein